MTNQGTTAEPEKVEQPTGEQPDVAKNTETQPGPIPYERFKEVNEQFKLAKQQLDDLLADKQKREKETRKATGEPKRIRATGHRTQAGTRTGT